MNLKLRNRTNTKFTVAHRMQEIERLFGIKRIRVNEKLVTIHVGRALPVVNLLDFYFRSSSARKSELIT